MQAFTTLSGIMAPLDRIDVDTDQIIPKQYLKTIQRTGLKEGLFADWRQRPDGTPDLGFFSNQRRYQDATILLTRENFGCGSSREHAPWALLDYGIRCILAWLELGTDSGATFDHVVEMHGEEIPPQVTWGTNPGMVTDVNGQVPNPADIDDEKIRSATQRALDYMGLQREFP